MAIRLSSYKIASYKIAYIFRAKKSCVKEVTDARNLIYFKEIFGLFNGVLIFSGCRATNEGMVCDNELERIWKVAIVAEL
jgi:hypothetical protein